MATNHGSSPAAWTTVTIIIVGFVVGAFAIVFGRTEWVVAAGGIVLAALVVGKFMQLMGLGHGSYVTSSQPVGGEERSTGHAELEGAR